MVRNMSKKSDVWLDDPKNLAAAYQELFAADAARASDDESDSEKMLLHIYGSDENMKKLVPLTQEQTYVIQKGKLLDYLARTDLDERTRKNSQKDLAVLEAWRENGFK
jgi:hypothetical protein